MKRLATPSGMSISVREEALFESSWIKAEGNPSKLGCTWIESTQSFNFALYSKHATRVELLLYHDSDVINPVITINLSHLTSKSGRVWHTVLKEDAMQGARYYAYKIDGPAPEGRFEWHHFDFEKVLFDPYAKALFFPPAFERQASARSGSNAGKAPLGVLLKNEDFDWGEDKVTRHSHDTVIYEMHIRGFTANPNSGIPNVDLGTFKGLKERIPYLQELGITVVEFMPVHQCDPDEGSVWGYMPINFFSLQHNYASTKDLTAIRTEFKELIKAFHQADIEVIIDVVYNHTGEGDLGGPNYCYKGIDNSTYYLISDQLPDDPFADFSGTGNTFHCANHAVRKLILDSMRYWVEEFHIDGFRFDLASIFSRNTNGSLNLDMPAIFSEISTDPVLSKVRLVAEPWDATGAYQLGAYALERNFPGLMWLQWNNRFRIEMREFLKSDPDRIASLMSRLYGSADIFPDDVFNAYHPYQSVNYLNAHDGFSLYDMLSYNQKTNPASEGGEENNHSWNHGFEGIENVPAEVMQLRRRQAKNAFCLLMLANGTPMFRAGDEFLQTQAGHNNPYNNDELNWLDWGKLQSNQSHFQFVKKIIEFRKTHLSLARSRFWREDIEWFGIGQNVDMSFSSRSLAYFLNGARQNDINLYVMINAFWEPLTFDIQKSGSWARVIDTFQDSPNDFVETGVPLSGNQYTVEARSIVVLTQSSSVP